MFNLGSKFGSGSNSNPQSTSENSSSSMTSPLSMPSMSISTQRLKSFTSKMSNSFNYLTGDNEKKIKEEAEDKKNKIKSLMNLLENLSLQCPSSNLGLIFTYSEKNYSPILEPDVKFKWFRMKDKTMNQIYEAKCSWYSPSVDDIGSIICVQCEDRFEEGYSKYLECGPIKADKLLTELTESILNNNNFETNAVSVSMGTEINKNLFESMDHFEEKTALSTDSPYVELDTKSIVEIDEDGIFINISTIENESADSPGKRNENIFKKKEFKTYRRGLRLAASSEYTVEPYGSNFVIISIPISHKTIHDEEPDNRNGKDGISSESDDSSTKIGPNKNETNSDNGEIMAIPESPPSNNDSCQESQDDKMKEFLSSSIISIPWSYEGHNHSPEAYISENDFLLTEYEREKLIKMAEEDGILFASTVCELAEFISSLPDGTKEIKICLLCMNKLMRDLLIISLRLLVFMPRHATRYERMKLLPWISEKLDNKDGENELVSNFADSITEVQKRLIALEEENVMLKKERNELTNQLLDVREELLHVKHRTSQVENESIDSITHSDYTHDDRTNQMRDSDHSRSENTFLEGSQDESQNLDPPSHNSIEEKIADGLSIHENKVSPSATKDAKQNNTDHQLNHELSAKIIELENRLAVIHAKELENQKVRDDLESKNESLSQEVDHLKRLTDETNRKLHALNETFNMQSKDVEIAESESANYRLEIQELKAKLQSLTQTESELAMERKENQSLKESLNEKGSLADDYKSQLELLARQMKEFTNASLREKEELKTNIEILENKTKEQHEENEVLKSDLLNITQLLESQSKDARQNERLKKELQESNDKLISLQGELNHLQRKSDSQARDLKKVLKESAESIGEYEKALIRKSEECNELYDQLNLTNTNEEDKSKPKGGLMKRLSMGRKSSFSASNDEGDLNEGANKKRLSGLFRKN